MERWTPATLGPCTVPNPRAGIVYTPDDAYVFRSADEHPMEPNTLLERAGPKERIFFDVSDPTFTVGIVTCGGLCPGLNSVIRALTITLWWSYGVRRIKGFRYGFDGLNSKTGVFVSLDPTVVRDIHTSGGSILGCARGPQDVSDMVTTLTREQVSVLFTVGGDGTLKGAAALCAEIARRNLRIAVVGVPKTIDNDIPLMEKTFGFATAVSRGVEVSVSSDDACARSDDTAQVIRSAHCEAVSQPNGVAIVKLMGRDSGAIAVEASLSSGDVNLCLVPEVVFTLDCVTEYVAQRIRSRGHCVVVIAEGAGQSLFSANLGSDASGNARLGDVGVELKKHLEKHLPTATIKYIDPSYIIRSAPALPLDEEFCTVLAQMAAHAGLAGRTACTVGYVCGNFVVLPLERVKGRKHVNVHGTHYQAMLVNIGQPLHLCKQ